MCVLQISARVLYFNPQQVSVSECKWGLTTLYASLVANSGHVYFSTSTCFNIKRRMNNCSNDVLMGHFPNTLIS